MKPGTGCQGMFDSCMGACGKFGKPKQVACSVLCGFTYVACLGRGG
jgi:hypothetical protein